MILRRRFSFVSWAFIFIWLSGCGSSPSQVREQPESDSDALVASASGEESAEDLSEYFPPKPKRRPPGQRIIPRNPVNIRTVSQSGHSSYVEDLSFSPDGRFLASIGDEFLRIWEMSTGLLVKRFPLGSSGIFRVLFLDNEHVFFWTSDDTQTYIINIFTDEPFKLPDQKELTILPGEKDHIAYAFSRSYDSDAEWLLRVLNLKTHRVTPRKFPLGNCNRYGYRFMDFDAQKHLAMFTCYERSIEVWDTQTMRQLIEIPVHPTRKVANYWPNKAYFVPGTDLIFGVMEYEGDTSEASVVNYRTGRVLNTYSIPHIVTDVEWMPSGGQAALALDDGSVRYTTHSAVLIDVVSGRQTAFRTEGRRTWGLGLSKDGRILAVPDADFRIRLFDTSTREEVRRLGENIGMFTTIRPSPVDSRLAVGSSLGLFQLWDLFSLSLDKTFTGLGNNERFKSLDFSPDGRVLFTSTKISARQNDAVTNASRFWDVQSGKLIRTETSPGYAYDVVSYMPDKKHFFRPTYKQFDVLDANTLQVKAHFGDSMLQYKVPVGRYGVVGYFSEKGIRSTGDLVLLHGSNYEQRTVIDHISLGFYTDFKIAAVDDHRFIALFDDQFHVYDLRRRVKIQQFPARWTHECSEEDLYVSEDGAYAALTHRTHSHDKCPEIVVMDIAKGEIASESAADGLIYSAAFFDGHRFFLYTDESGGIVVWNIEENTRIWMVSDGAEWIVYTEDGFFTASRNGGRLVAAVTDMHGYRIEQTAIRNNRPDIIMQRMKLGSDEMVEAFYTLYLKRVAKYGFDEDQLSYVFGAAPKVHIREKKRRGRFLDVTFSAADDVAEVDSYNIYVNDVPLFGMEGKRMSSRTVHETVQLHTGSNKIEISARNALGIESLREHFIEKYQTPEKGDLYYIGFGVSKYDDSNMNLKFAAKDAEDLGRVFRQNGALFNEVHVKTYTNDKVNGKAFRDAAALLKKSTVDDTVVVFVAGHGLYDIEGDFEYYYLLSTSKLDRLERTAVNYQQIESLLEGISARRKILLLDTCQSGAFDEQDVLDVSAQADKAGVAPRGIRRKQNPRKQKDLQRALVKQSGRYIYNDLFRRTGAIVFSSSRGNEFSYESDRYQNGNFTEAIIGSLTNGEADANRDRKISTNELRDYVMKTVSRTTDGLQHPVVDRDNLEMVFYFPLYQ
ncbi:MAG: caspase family protein [Deltaproteobacteria bacterium]|nr:caspase family protein [Deltaproteobacteria bacterium]MBN2671893.1 caspase family protein [Deltaproteobacteria bacterium]